MKKYIEIQNVVILMNGVSLKTNRGSLGFCNVSLIKDKDDFIVFDTGHYGDRTVLLEAFQKYKISCNKVKYVILSHLHWDHCSNISLFPEATIILSELELDYGKKVLERSVIDNGYSLEILEHLLNKSKYLTFCDTLKLSNNLLILETPGHTDGSISLLIQNDYPIIIAGDAVINRKDFESRLPSVMCQNSSIPRIKETIDKISKIGKIIIPGHDLPFWNINNKLEYIGDFKLEVISYPPIKVSY